MKGTEEQGAYWREQLAALPPLPKLPCDREPPPVSSFLRDRLTAGLEPGAWMGVQAIAAKAGATPQTVLLTALSALLFRYTRQSDLVVGTLLDNESAGANSLIPLRARVRTNAVAQELVDQIARTINDASRHDPLSLAGLSDVVEREGSAPQVALFNTALIYSKSSLVSWAHLTERIGSSCAEYLVGCSLLFLVSETANGADLVCEYDMELFEKGTVERLLRHLVTLLTAIAANPSVGVEQLALLSAEEHRQLLVDWNSTAIQVPKNAHIHEQFEQQVVRTPDAIAVVGEDSQLSYRELNVRANQLAHYLRALGVGPNELVGIRVERSPEMLVGLLGILKAGGAYLPLDPSYPPERIGFMLQDARAKVVLAQEHLVASLPGCRARVVCLDSDWPQIVSESDQNLANNTSGDDLAYVIYTSGSTGKPKGVMIEHRNVINFFAGMDERISYNGESTWLAVTSVSFDISVLELFWTLARGFRVVLYSGQADSPKSKYHGQAAREKRSIAQLIEHHKVTHFQCTPSMASMLLLDDRMHKALGHLQSLLIGGENFPAALAARLQQSTHAEIINMYGPTETTVWSTTYRLPESPSRVPVGRPIANTQIYVADTNLQLVPVGITGELLIGGAGVARGYWNRPELTAERFIPNPFNRNGAGRLYRTGDLARYLPDGNLELLGRIDQQVKIRGHRIELGEIESLLNEHETVLESVVVASQGPTEEKRLLAYIIAREGKEALPRELRRHLKDKLPDYMVPAQVILMPAFPQTPNGKIDRKALPEPQPCEPQAQANHTAPISPIEEALVELWAETLQVPEVRRDDDFFELGGDSLSAVQLLSRIRQTCEVDLPLESLFHSRSVAGLAKILEKLFLAQAETLQSTAAQAVNAKRQTSASPPVQQTKHTFWEPPRTPPEQCLAKIWAHLLGVKQVGRLDDFFALGGNSLLALNLFTEIENEFGKKLPLSTLLQGSTLQQLAAKVESYKQDSPDWSSLVPIQPEGNKPPLFFIHAAGGNVLFYGNLARHLRPDQPCYGLQALGLDGRREYLTTIEDMAAHYLNEIRTVQPDGPYYLGGFCLGGVIAYEMAQQLIKEGQQMAFLGLFDSYNASKLRPPESSREKLAAARQKMHFHWSNLRELGPREQFVYFTEKLKVARARELSRLSVKLGNFSRKLNPAKSGKRVEVFLEDFNEKLGCAYRPKVYVGNATIFRPRQNYAFHQDPTLGWGDLVKGGLEVINLPVNPGGLFVEPYVQVLASKLKECLQKAESSPRSNPQQEHTMNNLRVSHPDLAEVARTLRPLRFPTRFAVEICAECNLACAMCHHPAMRRPKGKMPFELWKRCADEIAAESPETQCWFSFCGEPLLEPNLLLKMIQYGKAVGLKSLNINTNGMLLTEKIGQRILDSGADLVVLGIDGFSRGTYEKIRVRGKRDVVYSNVETFLSQRQTRNTGPEIQVQFIEMEENSHELEAFKQHWLSHGATLKIRNKLSWGGKFNTPLDVPESERIPCPWAITMMHVFWDGRVPRCPGDTEGDESVGNAWDESLIALWDRLGADRAKHLEYRFQDLSERCHHCKDWMTGVAQRISPPSVSLQAS